MTQEIIPGCENPSTAPARILWQRRLDALNSAIAKAEAGFRESNEQTLEEERVISFMESERDAVARAVIEHERAELAGLPEPVIKPIAPWREVMADEQAAEEKEEHEREARNPPPCPPPPQEPYPIPVCKRGEVIAWLRSNQRRGFDWEPCAGKIIRLPEQPKREFFLYRQPCANPHYMGSWKIADIQTGCVVHKTGKTQRELIANAGAALARIGSRKFNKLIKSALERMKELQPRPDIIHPQK